MFELSCCRGLRFLLDWGTGSSGNRIRSLILAISSSSWAETWSRNCVQTNRNCWNNKVLSVGNIDTHTHTHLINFIFLYHPISFAKRKSRLMRSPFSVSMCAQTHTCACTPFQSLKQLTDFHKIWYWYVLIHNIMVMQSCVVGVPPAPLSLMFRSYSNRSWKH